MEPTVVAEAANGPTSLAARLRRIGLVRHAPVTALLILMGVCLVCLCGILGDFAALTALLPLGAVIAVWFSRTRTR